MQINEIDITINAYGYNKWLDKQQQCMVFVCMYIHT